MIMFVHKKLDQEGWRAIKNMPIFSKASDVQIANVEFVLFIR